MGANRNGNMKEVNRKYYDRDVQFQNPCHVQEIRLRFQIGDEVVEKTLSLLRRRFRSDGYFGDLFRCSYANRSPNSHKPTVKKAAAVKNRSPATIQARNRF